MTPEGSRARRQRTAWARVVAGGLAGGVFGAVLLAAAAPSQAGPGLPVRAPAGATALAPAAAPLAAPDGPPTGARIQLTDVGPVTLTPDGELTISGTVTPTPGAPLDGPWKVRLLLHEGRLGTRAEVAAWTQAATVGTEAGATKRERAAQDLLGASREIGETDLGTPNAGTPSTFTFTVDASDLRLPTRRTSFGPRGFAVEVVGPSESGTDTDGDTRGQTGTDPDAVLARATTFAVWSPKPDDATSDPAEVAVLVPVTGRASAQAGSDSATTRADLAPGGRLSELLAATNEPEVGWLLDPALVASVARVGGMLAPLPTAPGSPTPTPTTSGSPTPSATSTGDATAGAASAREDARTWLDALSVASRSRDVAWLPWGDPDVAALATAKTPDLLRLADRYGDYVVDRLLGTPADLSWGMLADGPATQPAADLLAASRRKRLVVQAPTAPDGETPQATERVRTASGTLDVLAADPVLSTELADAGTATDAPRARAALLADLAAVTLEDREGSARLLLVPPRSWTPSATAVRATLAALQQASWVRTRAPSELPAPTGSAHRLDKVAGASTAKPLDAGHIRAVSGSLTRLGTFAVAVGTQAGLLLPPAREQSLSLVSTAWRGHSGAELAAARAPLATEVADLYGGVSILEGGPYNVLTSNGDLPLQLRNRTPYDLTVQLRLQPQTGQVETPDPVTVRLPAHSPAFRVKVPLHAVASGDVVTVASLTTPTGQRISPKVTLTLRVRREWESRGLIALVTLFGGLLVVGVVRTVRRGRRERIRAEDVPDIDDLAVEHEERLRQPALAGVGPAGVVSAAVPTALAPPVTAAPAPTGIVSAALLASREAPTVVIPPIREPIASWPPSGSGMPPGWAGGTPSAPVTSAPLAGEDGEAGDAAEAPESEGASTAALARSSAVMAAGTLLSRLLGFVRVAVLASAIGMSGPSADAFSVANKIPNIVYMLLAGGVLNAVLVPQITRAARQGAAGKEYVDRLLTAAIGLLALITLVVTAASPLLVRLYTGSSVDDQQLALATVFGFWCLPQVFFYGLYTVWGQVLNARGAFGAYMWAPVINNVVAIAGLAAFITVEGAVGGQSGRSATGWGASEVLLLAGTATLGVVAQALVLWPVLRRTGFSWRPRWGFRGVGLGSASRVAGWTFAAVVVGQLGYMITSKVLTSAGHLATLAHGEKGAHTGSALYDSSFLLFMLPHSLVAVSLVTALFTRLSRSAQARDTDAVRADLSLGLRTVATTTVLATAGMLALARVGVQFLHWNPGVAYGAMAMSLGLVPFSASYLQQRVFYAYEDARTPFFTQLPVVVLTATASLLSSWLLDPQWVLVGVGLGMAAGNLLGCLLLARRLSRLLGGTDGPRVLRVHARLGVAAVLAGTAAWLVANGLIRLSGADGVDEAGRFVAGAALLVGAGVLLTVYLVLARAMRVTELDLLLRPLTRRLRGGNAAPSGRTADATDGDTTDDREAAPSAGDGGAHRAR